MTQRVAAVARQVVGLAAFVMGFVTAGVSAIHLPAGVAGVMSLIGGSIFAIEQYVGDTSTGNTTVPKAPASSTPSPSSTASPSPPTVRRTNP